MRRKYDWPYLRDRVREAILTGEIKPHYKDVAEFLAIPLGTCRDNIDLTEFNGGSKIKHMPLGAVEGIIEDSRVPVTKEEMLRWMGLDEEEYSVISFECTGRDIVVTPSERDLSVDEGRWSGIVRSGLPTRTTVFTTKLVAQPRTVTLPKVALQRLEIKPPPVWKTREPTHHKGDSILVIPDLHFGFSPGPSHDVEYIDAVLELATKTRPTDIVFTGDVLDLAEFTDRFVNDPGTIRTTQEALNAAAEFLTQLAVSTGAKIHWLEGNHEVRFAHNLRRHMSSLAGLHVVGDEGKRVDIPYLMNLDRIKVNYIDGYPNNFLTIGDVTFVHGDLVAGKPGATSSKMLEKYGRSIVFGHTHRREYIEDVVYSDMLGGYRTIFAYNPGCGCVVGPATPGGSQTSSWTKGAGIIRIDRSGKHRAKVYDMPYDSKDGFLI